MTREQGSQRELNYEHIYDCILRITVKWKPENFEELMEDKEQWNLAATDLIHWIYQTTPESPNPLLKKNGPVKQVVPILDLNPNNLHSLIAPKVTTIVSYKMFIFSIRVSLSQLWSRPLDQQPDHKTNSTEAPCGRQHIQFDKQ
jgi:hypothetical protein